MKSIELVCINWGNFEDAKEVTKYCFKLFPRFSKATIFHPETWVNEVYFPDLNSRSNFKNESTIKVFRCKSKSQHFCCLKEMPKYLTCDFALSIQWDGFIIRPDLWTDEFLEYDYIAPPWPLQNIINPLHRVGSGGFCLFSRRLAEFWAENGDPEIPNDWERGAVNRKKYEDAGFKFAPIQLAARFGKEHDLEDIKIEEGETFGFHDFRINSEQREFYRKRVYEPFNLNCTIPWKHIKVTD